MTEEPPGEGAAEPAEAAGPTATNTNEERFRDGETDVTVDEVSGIGPAYAERLSEAGIETVADLLAADPENLAESTDVSAKRIGRWQDRAEDA
jgi:predicted flap endonuclease-1-like 5' DNA nuclease